MASNSVSAVADRAAPPTGRSLQAVSGTAGIPNADPLALLRAPFPPNQISKLPKPYKKDSPKGKCSECGGHHGLPAVHLDYVGHAALTDRLLDTDPEWTWEPVADPVSHGLPVAPGGMWIKLIVCGVSRYGYGCADGKTGGDAIKETIGDALRNAAMRFGAALDLWHKGDLHADEEADEPTAAEPASMPDAEWAKLVQLIEATKADTGAMIKHYGVKNLRHLNHDQYGHALGALNAKLAKMAKAETNAKAREQAPPANEFAEILEDQIPY